MFLETAIAAARVSGQILIDNLKRPDRKRADRKDAFDIVTEVDRLSEAAIVDLIRQRHPDHHILAEESGGSIPDQGYLWIIDPLDGTKNYFHEFPMFAVSIALKFNQELLVGLVLDPIRNELFHAEKNRGAFLNGDPIRVSTATDFSRCLLATGFPFRARKWSAPYFDAFIKLFHQISDFRRAGAAALDLAYVACGRLDGFWEIMLNPWDVAAGTLLIQEAGGQVSDLWGGDSYLQTGHIVASNGRIHSKITRVAGQAFVDLKPSHR
jgi:myo-inositol-1(or 4)-monophosphatase